VGQEHLPGAVDLGPLQRRRSSKVLVGWNRLLRSTFRPRMRVAADTIVQSLSGDADAPADCTHEKDLQIQAFPRAAEGIRTLDLLHGKQNAGSRASAESPGKERFPSYRRSAILSSFSREIAGVSGLKPDSGPCRLARRLRTNRGFTSRPTLPARGGSDGAVAAAPPHVQQPAPANRQPPDACCSSIPTVSEP
jgi:hypothetical protein